MLGNLSPIAHESNPFLYRVPLKRENDGYILFVADNFVRNFSSENLPDEIKSKLAMIVAASKTDTRDWDVYNCDVYVPKHPVNGFSEIGWQISDSFFCICLSVKTLNDLRGK